MKRHVISVIEDKEREFIFSSRRSKSFEPHEHSPLKGLERGIAKMAKW
jgi:hypothetical protein